MKKLTGFILACALVFFQLACFDDSGSDLPKGTLKVTVNTSADIWDYPKLVSGTNYAAYAGDTSYTLQYYDVGGDSSPGEDSNTVIEVSHLGDKINYVYIYSELGDSSRDKPVLYRGTSSSNDSEITINGIVAGTYYVVAFYDYSYGGNRENLLNRYDRYAIYTDSPAGGTANSTPFVDKAATVTISENGTAEITLEIKRDWVLGKPNLGDGGTGRFFLKEADGIPAP